MDIKEGIIFLYGVQSYYFYNMINNKLEEIQTIFLTNVLWQLYSVHNIISVLGTYKSVLNHVPLLFVTQLRF